MTELAEAKPKSATAGLRGYWALAALIAGLALGAMSGALAESVRAAALEIAGFVGTLWLNALKMTVIPLVIALLITGIAKSREAALGGRIAGRSVLWIVILCTASAIFGAIAIQLLNGMFPLPRATAADLQGALAALEQPDTQQLAGVADFFKNMIPANVFAAATNGDVLPLVLFALLFALALARVGDQGRRSIVALFEAIADTLLVIIGWVLWIAPLGVFALAYLVGWTAGGSAFAGLGHYVIVISVIGILVTLLGYPLAIVVGGVRPGAFVKGMIAPQTVAVSTRSSLASLPAMLAATPAMGIREQVADVTLPIAVALFRATGPAMNVAVAFYVAHWLGYEPTLAQMIAATAVGALMSYGAVSLPGEITFISSIAPIAMALGVPIAPLALLVAVEMIPDISRTIGNVTLDVAVTAVTDRTTRDGEES